MPKATREAAGSGQRDPEEAADLLDADLRKAAAQDLREFRQELSGQGKHRSTGRQPESKARKKRRREAKKKKAQTPPAPKGALWATVAAASASTAEGYSNGGVGSSPPSYLLVLLLGFWCGWPWRASRPALLDGHRREFAGASYWGLATGSRTDPRSRSSESGECLGLGILAPPCFGSLRVFLLSLVTKLQMALFRTSKRRKAAQTPARNEGRKKGKPFPLEPALACTPQGEAYHLPTCGHVKGRSHRILEAMLRLQPVGCCWVQRRR